jgi:hypothetical protein
VQVSRFGGGPDFESPLPEERFFVTATVEGGPYFRPVGPQRYYTGDTINPQVVLRQPSGFPVDATVMVDVELPQVGTGNILTGTGLRGPGELGGDQIDARANTLIALEREGGPLVLTSTQTFELSGDGDQNGTGSLEPDGVYGRALQDLTRFEGNYTFHAKATYSEVCIGTREATWTLYVSVGIDPDHTDVTIEPTATLPDGRQCFHMRFTPQDRYGNHLGPGRLDAFQLQPQPGTTLDSDARDLGNGSYEVDVCWDPNSVDPPQIGVAQPERPPTVIGPAQRRRHVYSVKFLCGQRDDGCVDCGPVRPGSYATEINIHNYHDRDVGIAKRVLPVVLAGAARGREPNSTGPMATDKLLLPAHSATMDDCCRILELLLGARPATPTPLTIGVLEITSPVELSVTAVYTVTDTANGATSIDVQSIAAKPTT